MKLVFANARKCQQFAAMFANLKSFTDNVSIYFKEESVYIQTMDDSHCSLFECRLMSKWFKTYQFDPNTDMGQIAINIVMLNKVLNTLSDSQELSIEIEPDSDKIHINFENNNTDTSQFNKYYELPLITLENQLLDAIVGDTLVDLNIDSKMFHSLMNQLTMFNDNLKITFNEEDIEFTSAGSEGRMTAKIKAEDLAGYAIPEETVLTQTYSLKYVQMMATFNKLAPEMELGFSAEMPMLMKYALGDNNDPESFVRIHLAPKIVDEDTE
jgi:proliferating cell nuclear antigen PCNA